MRMYDSIFAHYCVVVAVRSFYCIFQYFIIVDFVCVVLYQIFFFVIVIAVADTTTTATVNVPSPGVASSVLCVCM